MDLPPCMQCPRCKDARNSVIDSRVTDGGKAIRRRRVCDACDYRFTTFERARAAEILVIKHDGTREPYDRDKLKRGIRSALVKRNASDAQLDDLVNTIEEKLVSTEVTSKDIGRLVMATLKELDPVAYIRFASVYQEFDDVESFKKIIETL